MNKKDKLRIREAYEVLRSTKFDSGTTKEQDEIVVNNAIGILDLYFQNARKTNEAMAALSAYNCLIYICDKYMKEKENSNAKD